MRTPFGRNFAAWYAPYLLRVVFEEVDLLLALPARAPRGVAVGDSLRFLAEIGKLALELLARGRFLPMLDRRAEGWVARWRAGRGRPVDAERLRLLADAMPPLLRAELPCEPELGAPPRRLVSNMLDEVVDACAILAAASGPGRAPRRPRRAASAAESWIAALSSADGLVVGADRVLAELAEQLDAWRGAREQYAAHRMFRTCFRLSLADAVSEHARPGGVARDGAQPADAGTDRSTASDEPPWRVDIMLQAKDDPSVLVSASEVWSSNGSGLRILGHRLEHPQERLLGGLGHALRLWPELEPALRVAAPTAVELTPRRRTGSCATRRRPSRPPDSPCSLRRCWVRGYRSSCELAPRRSRRSGNTAAACFGIDGLCDYEWNVAIGSVTLTLDPVA